jgi:NAD(P)-dependent dehydrogenase (short-subunit alcohol dehydrogenase family)
MDLTNKIVVVTGAARGLGAEIARGVVAKGAKAVLSDIDGVDLQDLGRELSMPTIHCNVTDRDQIEALGRFAMETFGALDVWINNAGIWMPYAPAEEIDFGRAHQLVEVNYFGVAYGMLEAVKHMRGRNQGCIVNILSVRSLKGKALGAAYSASKFAAEGFTQAVRDELKDSGITVLGVYPYRMKTGLFGEDKHADYESSMEPADVARHILENVSQERPAEKLEIWNADDVRASSV